MTKEPMKYWHELVWKAKRGRRVRIERKHLEAILYIQNGLVRDTPPAAIMAKLNEKVKSQKITIDRLENRNLKLKKALEAKLMKDVMISHLQLKFPRIGSADFYFDQDEDY